MIKRSLFCSLFVASLICLSSCTKAKVVEIPDLVLDDNYSSETQASTSLSDKIKDITDSEDTVGDFSKDFDKRGVVESTPSVAKVSDASRIEELKGIMRDNLSKAYTSIRYSNRLVYDIVVGTEEKSTRVIKDENNRPVNEEYLTGSTIYNRYIGDNLAEITRNNKYYHSLYVNDKTNYGYNSVNVRETYLIDNGDKTISYSKEYDMNNDVPERLAYKAYIVDRDLESENISFNYLNVLDNNEKYEITEEHMDGKSYYTYKTFISLDMALEISNLNKELLGLSDTSSYKTVIKLYFDRNTLELVKADISLKETLDLVSKELGLGYSLQANSCKVEITVVSTENNTVVDIPTDILNKLPSDILVDLEKENSLNSSLNVDNGLIMDGDFTVYGKEDKQ